MFSWPKKHQYNAGWPEGSCVLCGRQAGLDLWQIKEIPCSMGDAWECKNGVKIKLIEFITGNFDCLIA